MLEVENQGVSRAMLLPKAPGKNAPFSLFKFCWVSAILGFSRLTDTFLQSLCSRVALCVCVCVCSSFYNDASHTAFRVHPNLA